MAASGCGRLTASIPTGRHAHTSRLTPGGRRPWCCSTTSATRDCSFPASSSTISLSARLRAAARAVGAQRVFPPEASQTIIDDHTPFLRAGVPAVDLIDWTYPGHDLRDSVGRLSRTSLDAVGETVVELVIRLRAPSAAQP
jgi:hypothetical protein